MIIKSFRIMAGSTMLKEKIYISNQVSSWLSGRESAHSAVETQVRSLGQEGSHGLWGTKALAQLLEPVVRAHIPQLLEPVV